MASSGTSPVSSSRIRAASQQKATKALLMVNFKDEIVPVEVRTKRVKLVDTMKAPPGTTAEGLARLKPRFKKDGGIVTRR